MIKRNVILPFIAACSLSTPISAFAEKIEIRKILIVDGNLTAAVTEFGGYPEEDRIWVCDYSEREENGQWIGAFENCTMRMEIKFF